MSPERTRESGITFAVDEVERAAAPLPEIRTHEAIRLALGSAERLLSSFDYHGSVVEGPSGHGLLAAVHLAYDGHRPLALGPDAIWLTIAQGLVRHVDLQAEELRSRLVRHEGRLVLEVDRPDFVLDSPENPWPEVFSEFGRQIRAHATPEACELVLCDFSTTGPVERAASEIALMEGFRHYFEYVMTIVCGIPEITIEGTVDDWHEIARRAEGLAAFGLGWWVEWLRPVLAQFVRAASGEVDRDFWRSIYKVRSSYGTKTLNGWITHLFPYVLGEGVAHDLPNPILTGDSDGISGMSVDRILSDVLPAGRSRVGVRARTPAGTRSLEFVAGLLAVEQDERSLALRPRIGWAVCDAAPLELLLDRLVAEHETEARRSGTLTMDAYAVGVPPDLVRLYDRIGSASLFGRRIRILPLDRIRRSQVGWSLVFAESADGSVLAIEPSRSPDGAVENQVLRFRGRGHRRPEVIAGSLADWLRQALDSEPGRRAAPPSWRRWVSWLR